MRGPISFKGEISPWLYAIVAPLLLLAQPAAVELAYRLHRVPLVHDAIFWLLPMRRLAVLPNLSAPEAALAFAFSLAVAWMLAWLSFRRASRARRGHALAPLAIVPALQILAVAVLAMLPRGARPASPEPQSGAEDGTQARQVIQGVIAGVAIIVFAVLVSAVSFGAYGWGLFVLTPLTVGITTAYIVNRRVALGTGPTVGAAMMAAALGSVALVMFALEGLVCLLMAAPLAIIVVLVGAVIGQSMALALHRPENTFKVVALLPAVFALEAAMPPSVTLATDEAIVIAAPPSAVWQALTSEAPIAASPGMVGQAGLAYPLRSRLLGEGVGAVREGHFSTGVSSERITGWAPGRRLAFTVVSQPPAMEEMSPYRRVHAPHVQGYFDTSETRFELEPMAGGRTRLTARASHILRIDPVLYWAPIARWAVRQNTRRVLRDLKLKAESGG